MTWSGAIDTSASWAKRLNLTTSANCSRRLCGTATRYTAPVAPANWRPTFDNPSPTNQWDGRIESSTGQPWRVTKSSPDCLPRSWM